MIIRPSRPRRRTITGMAGLLLAATLFAACQGEPEQSTSSTSDLPQVSFGVLRAPTGALGVVTDDRGGFEETGVEVDFQSFAEGGGPAVVQAMAGGTPDIALLNTAAVVLALGQGTFDVKIVSVAADPSRATPLLAAEGIESVEDLRGKRVSVPTGGGQYYLLGAILAQHGMTFDDIDYRPLPIGEAQAAFITGQLDAVISSINGTVIIQENVPGVEVLWDGDDFEVSRPDLLVVTPQAMEENPEGVARFVRAFHEYGVAYLNDDATREEAVQAIQDYLASVGAAGEELGATKKGIEAIDFFGLEEGQSRLHDDAFLGVLETQAQFWVDEGTLPRIPDFEAAIAPDLSTDAPSEGLGNPRPSLSSSATKEHRPNE